MALAVRSVDIDPEETKEDSGRESLEEQSNNAEETMVSEMDFSGESSSGLVEEDEDDLTVDFDEATTSSAKVSVVSFGVLLHERLRL